MKKVVVVVAAFLAIGAIGGIVWADMGGDGIRVTPSVPSSRMSESATHHDESGWGTVHDGTNHSTRGRDYYSNRPEVNYYDRPSYGGTYGSPYGDGYGRRRVYPDSWGTSTWDHMMDGYSGRHHGGWGRGGGYGYSGRHYGGWGRGGGC